MAALDRIPPGLSHDEAYNGVTAIQVLEGTRLIFFEINKGIEPLIIYLEALAFHAFGIGPTQLRLVNVVCGQLTVALIYPLTRRLVSRHVALLAMAGVSVSFWAVFVSRLTLRAVTLPPLLIVTLYFLLRGLAQNNRWTIIHLSLSGLLAGLTMYTYLSSRFVPFIGLTLFGGWQIYNWFSQSRLHNKSIFQDVVSFWKSQAPQLIGLLLHLLIWVAVFAPLANYYWENQESFSRRANQVTTIPRALEGDMAPLLNNIWQTLGMFTIAGDTTDRYNLDGRPIFDWWNGLLFYVGLGVVIVNLIRLFSRRPVANQEITTLANLLLLIWLFFMLLPDFITDDSPHFLRTIGALPAVYIVWAIGLSWLIKWLTKSRFKRHLPVILSAISLLLMTGSTVHDYFNRWANAPEAREIYGADIAEIAAYVKQNYSDDLTVISAAYYRDLDPFRYRVHWAGQPPFTIWFDGQTSLALPPAESGLEVRYIFADSAPPADLWLNFLQRQPAESGRAYQLYRRRETVTLPTDLTPLGLTINQEVQLLGYQILGRVTQAGKFQLLVAWQAWRTLPPGTDYTFLGRLWDTEGRLWAEADGLGYAPSDWQPGVRGWQLLTIRLPGDLPAGPFDLTLELVNRQTGLALPTATGETVIHLETVPLTDEY